MQVSKASRPTAAGATETWSKRGQVQMNLPPLAASPDEGLLAQAFI